jgi:hypothetical protein
MESSGAPKSPRQGAADEKRPEGHPTGCNTHRAEKMATDLAGPGYHINRCNLLVRESKADMQKRGQASPDDGGALALTLAQPEEANKPHVESCRISLIATLVMLDYNEANCGPPCVRTASRRPKRG